MNKENFEKGIEGLKNIRMTDTEKARMLERVFSLPTESPYMRRIPAFALACSLILVLSFGGATYASVTSLPGDLLYPIKTRVVEPMLDIVNYAPEKKIVWEEEKVMRRIVEAEKLAEKDELNDERAEKLERSIEKSSEAFARAVGEADGEKAEDRKEEFRKKIDEREEVSVREEKKGEEKDEKKEENKEKQREKVKKLKATATRALDNDDRNEDNGD